MARQDYYVILGIPRGESCAGIQAAFRDLLRRHHPARGGRRAIPRFHDVLEAYHVLSDPARRASYDNGLWREEADEAARPSRPVLPSPSRRRPPVEPLSPEPVSLMRDFHATRPSREEIADRVRSNFEPRRDSRQELDALRLEVVIGPEQAEAGGTLSLGVPVFVPCSGCHGAGRVMAYRCSECMGSGMREEERPARIYIPPAIEDGTIFQVPLSGLGISNLYLEVRVRVAS